MELNLTINQLGNLLKNVCDNFETTLMTKIKLSGGFMTMFGEVSVGNIPTNALSFKGNNIIDLNIKTDEKQGATLKITGMKTDFKVEIAETRYKEICKGKFSEEVKINSNECKLKIDSDMIFTIKAKMDDVLKLVQK